VKKDGLVCKQVKNLIGESQGTEEEKNNNTSSQGYSRTATQIQTYSQEHGNCTYTANMKYSNFQY